MTVYSQSNCSKGVSVLSNVFVTAPPKAGSFLEITRPDVTLLFVTRFQL